MSVTIKLSGVAVAVPEHVIRQSDAAAVATHLFSEKLRGFRRLAPIFENAGIRTRYSVRPLSWFYEPHGWADRMEAYIDGASRLFVRVATRAIQQSGLTAKEIDSVVVVSTTGFAAPSIEALVSSEMGFRPDIERVPIFGLGCAAGVSGLSVASRLATARPGTKVLFVAIELCSLAFRLDEPTPVNVVASALFGDGAAACILSADGDGVATVESTGEHLFADTLDIMGWRVDDPGLGIVLAQSLPPFVTSRIRPALAGILARHMLQLGDIDRFVCHPGGAKVLDALESALSIGQGALNDEREILADYGNMSSPTVLFVLDRAIRTGLPERSAMVAMGPGFSTSCVTLRRAA
ncbi:type III polyketide synthase [Pseudorhodoplanes sinuspersici]|uniref:Type III polyketide synthase n=1 Tax=Pseudorhodoplanes sinuspersici TaxID=1235591 RepID=A0A1W6ZSI2_9HYPH|nr:3-oxoacyl-[acyl-carrier-protein] synthase III C-terminal domain-containing protein [Pseudorhodoplanes sinuspersici]ARQ00303.1 type III polyketide synthase [Pseudorhodoplanes sinuspersici]RKE67541.1 (2-(2,4-dihydroxy-6-methylphenyl)-2- oxoethyl)-4-hydroxy-2-pyrone synthase [Pseudorhodoplanes sinuspersici]